MLKGNLFILTFLSIALSCCYSEASEGGLQEESIAAKALSCFDKKHIYDECNEAYRLNPSGNINIPMGDTGFFCTGPCLKETQLVLNCIDQILSNFEFYNKATVQQMRRALDAGCSASGQRGKDTVYHSENYTELPTRNFNLGYYIGQEINAAYRLKSQIVIRFYLFILAAVPVIHFM